MRDTYVPSTHFKLLPKSATNGDDFFFASDVVDHYSGGLGSDTVSYQFAKSGVWVNLDDGYGRKGAAQGDFYDSIENVRGTIYSDTLIGSDARNTLDGGSGDDFFVSSSGYDTIIGGSGFDTISYAGQETGIFARLDTGFVLKSPGDQDSLDSIEGLRATNADDTIHDSDQNSVIETLDGDDTIFAAKGNNTYNGGAGVDTLDYGGLEATTGNSNGVYVDLETGRVEKHFKSDLSEGHSGRDSVAGIENVRGTGQNDIFIGRDDADNVFHGLSGNDIFYADGGADTYNGGGGSDTVVVGGSGATVDLASRLGSGGDAEGDDYQYIENVGLTGEGNVAIGNALGNTLTIVGSDHQAFGRDGDDTFIFASEEMSNGNAEASLENATADGGSGEDAMDFSFAVATPLGGDGMKVGLLIDLENGTAIARSEDGGTVSFSNMEIVTGSRGSDEIVDGEGDWIMSGGGGNDVFVFDHDSEDQYDVIRDFEVGIDQIDLSATGVRGFNDLTNSGDRFMEAAGADTLIHTGDGNSIRLDDVAMSSLDSGDFIF